VNEIYEQDPLKSQKTIAITLLADNLIFVYTGHSSPLPRHSLLALFVSGV